MHGCDGAWRPGISPYLRRWRLHGAPQGLHSWGKVKVGEGREGGSVGGREMEEALSPMSLRYDLPHRGTSPI